MFREDFGGGFERRVMKGVEIKKREDVLKLAAEKDNQFQWTI
jgi:hypothetical protein